MTLRWRLTLLIALTVALVLLGSGLGLHYLLRASLYRGLDDSLVQAATLLSGFIDVEDGAPELELEGEVPPALASDLSVWLLADDGSVLTDAGVPLASLPTPAIGFSDQGDLRVLTQRASGATLVVARDLDAIEDSIERFDAVFLAFAPLALLSAGLLGYFLAGRALAPVDRMTRSALDLAQRRAWGERLPEPPRRDELWRLARATNELLVALARVIESERRFTADAAHELRTPLTVLRGRLEQALEEAGDNRTRERLERAVGANEELLRLTETLLLLARAEAGQSVALEPVALDEVAFDAAEALRERIEEKGLALAVELPEQPVWVRGDRQALAVLVRNVLDNAVKFTPAGAVRVGVERAAGGVRLSVEDSGPGFREEDLSKVFERFYQADVRHRQSGSGLGLALARSIAEWHGGRLEAGNREEGGARVTLWLPTEKA